MTLAEARKELDSHGIKYTRKDYMGGTVDHQTYYGQFAFASVLWLIRTHIGEEHILASQDEHFNDIPLLKWDALASGVPSRLVSLSNMFTQDEANAVPSVSLSDQVCILKAAARIVKDRG